MRVALLTLQTVQDGRQFLKYVDPKLGVPLPERDYGGNCLIYDTDNETDPFHNVWVRSAGGQAWGGPRLPRWGLLWSPRHSDHRGVPTAGSSRVVHPQHVCKPWPCP